MPIEPQRPDVDEREVPRADAPRISLIVVAARHPQLLKECLATLTSASAGAPPCETIIVLNGADRAVAELAWRVVGAHVVVSAVNLGLAGAANLGRSRARGELLVLLHDDALPQAGWLSELVMVADAHPEAGAVGSCVLNLDGSLQGAGGVVLADASPWFAPDPELGRVRAVDWCQSCSLLVRTSTWDAIGGADERLFPAYCVDVDLGLAVWSIGQSVLCAPASRVRHRRGVSLPDSYRHFLMRHNQHWLREKWQPSLAGRELPQPDLDGALRRTAAKVAAEGASLPVALAPGPQAVHPPPAVQVRERVALERAVAVQTAFIGEIEETVAELSSLRATLTRRADELERMRREAAEREQHLQALNHALEQAQGMLNTVFSGGWWRLRARVLPLLGLARWLRRRGPPA